MPQRVFARIGSFFKGIGGYAMRHKIQAVVVVLVVAGIGFWGYGAYAKTVTTTQYVLAVAHDAPIEETVTGSGQVASEHQLNLSPKASGTLTSVRVKAGDRVAAGEVIATVDSTDAEKSLRDAAANLESARISYLQSQTSNTDTVEKSREGVFSTSATVYSDLAATLTGINAIMQGKEVSGSFAVTNVYAYSKLLGDNPALTAIRDRLISDYAAAQSTYASSYANYNATSRDADPASTGKLADETYAAAQATAQAAKDLNDYLMAVQSRYAPTDSSAPAILSTHLASSQTYLSTANTDLSSALAAKNDINSSIQQSSASGDATLSEESAQLAYQKAQNAYQDAKDNLADYAVVAPFSGTIAQVNQQKFDQASSGTAVAILVTDQQIATLSLNEVDAASVRVGQPATLTFDAIDGLSIPGTVAEMDTVGTVSQGVVSYTIKIGFNEQDPRILPGMTVNATIVTAHKDSALVVPSSAIKTQGTQSYVEVADYTPPARSGGAGATSTGAGNRFRNASSTGASASSTRAFGSGSAGAAAFAARASGPTVDAKTTATHRVNVTTGITSGTLTEITSGLSAGQFVVSQSLNASGNTTTQSRSLLSLFGARGAGAGAARTGGAAGAGAARTGAGATGAARAGGGGAAVFRGGGG